MLTIGFLSGNPTTVHQDTAGHVRGSAGHEAPGEHGQPDQGRRGRRQQRRLHVDVENTDGDNFFCQPKGGDIKTVFLAAVGQLANRLPRIIE